MFLWHQRAPLHRGDDQKRESEQMNDQVRERVIPRIPCSPNDQTKRLRVNLSQMISTNLSTIKQADGRAIDRAKVNEQINKDLTTI